MSNSFYTAASSMLNAQRKLGVLSGNIANIKTPGYRAQNLVTSTFEQEMLIRLEKGNSEKIGSGAPIQIVDAVPTSFDPSALQQTERPFDLAINGEGYFNVQGLQQANTEDEDALQDEEQRGDIYLTRNGSFDLDSQGFLVLKGVGRVQGTGGDIQLNSSNFIVERNGDIYQDGKRIDRLLITKPAEDDTPIHFGKGVFRISDYENNQPVNDVDVLQKTLEASNVDINREMTRVMEAQRALQAASTAMKIVDRMNQSAAKEIASL